MRDKKPQELSIQIGSKYRRVYFVDNWTMGVSSNSCNIDKIGLGKKHKRPHWKKDHKNLREERKINLTESDSRTMSSTRFTAHKNPQKILGKKNPRSRKTKITQQSPQLNLSLIYLQARSDPSAKTQLRTHRKCWQKWKHGKSRT